MKSSGQEFMYLSKFDADYDGEEENVLMVGSGRPRFYEGGFPPAKGVSMGGFNIIPYSDNGYLTRFDTAPHPGSGEPIFYDGRIRYYIWDWRYHKENNSDRATFYFYDVKRVDRPINGHDVFFNVACEIELNPVLNKGE